MNKLESIKLIADYLVKHQIDFSFFNENDKLIDFALLDTIYLCTYVPNVMGSYIETSIRFRDEHLYCQSYYCQPIVRNDEEAIRAARIVNYLNMNLTYDCDSLYNHVFIFDEGHGDVFNGFLCRYEMLVEYFYETMLHILNYSVQQIMDVCKAVVFYVHGNIDYKYATRILIDHQLLGKPMTEE